MDDLHQKPDPDPLLNYRSGWDVPRPNILAITFIVFGGIVCGAAAVIAVGFFVAMGVEHDEFQFKFIPAALFFLFVCFIALLLSVRMFWTAPRRWLLGGLLIGICVMALIEGFCFAAG